MPSAPDVSAALPTPSSGERFARRWLQLFLMVFGLWVFIPFLAPIFMHLGWTPAGKAVYLIYSFFCHQLPERSIFLFGRKATYSLAEIQAVWQPTANPLVLRGFIGNAALGWKIAWSDRMISLYTSVWLFAAVWSPFRRKVRPLHGLAFALLVLPLIIDGTTHALSDLAGIGQGFRDTNQWLVALTHNSLPAALYAGDALGSFNSLARLLTGVLAGLGIVWFGFPHLEASFGKE